MPFETKFSDPDQKVINMAGVRLQGFADGEFLTIEFESDAFGDVVGTDGEVARSRSNDRRATATVKLLQTSSSNDSLSAMLNTDLNADNGAGVGSFQMIDLQGNTLVFAAQAWVMKAPDQSQDRTAKSREWKLRLANCVANVGGNG